MVTAANLQTQSYKFQQDTLTGRWCWTTRMDVSGAAPSYSITDIVSPYGILRDSIPIPGDIVEAMAESVNQIRTQFPPDIFIGPPSSLIFEVDEGRGFSSSQTVVLTNVGVFGSLMGSTLTSSAEYVSVTPAQVGNLASQESGSFDVAVNSATLLALNSPYSEVVTVQDPNATNNPQVLPISIVVRPKAVIGVAPVALVFNAIKPLSGLFSPIPTQTFVVQNTGPAGSILDWQIQKVNCAPWLASFSPVSGTLASGETETVTVLVQPPTSTLRGVFTETLRVSGFSENQYLDVGLSLVVT